MICGVGDHGVDDDEVICVLCDLWEEVGDPEPAVSAALEFEVVFAKESDLVEEGFGSFAGLEWFTVEASELGFVVEGVEVAKSAAEADMDDASGFGSKVWCIAGIRAHGIGWVSEVLFEEERCECCGGDGGGGEVECLSSGEVRVGCWYWLQHIGCSFCRSKSRETSCGLGGLVQRLTVVAKKELARSPQISGSSPRGNQGRKPEMAPIFWSGWSWRIPQR